MLLPGSEAHGRLLPCWIARSVIRKRSHNTIIYYFILRKRSGLNNLVLGFATSVCLWAVVSLCSFSNWHGGILPWHCQILLSNFCLYFFLVATLRRGNLLAQFFMSVRQSVWLYIWSCWLPLMLPTVSFFVKILSKFPNFINGLVYQTLITVLLFVKSILCLPHTKVLMFWFVHTWPDIYWLFEAVDLHSYSALGILFWSDVRNFGIHCVVANHFKFYVLIITRELGHQFLKTRYSSWTPLSSSSRKKTVI